MKFLVLGPLAVTSGGKDITPTAPKHRQLLALLALNSNRPVSIEHIVNELWEYKPPSTAVAGVYTYVTQLRKILHGAGEDTERLVTLDQAYQLRVHTGELDLDRFTDRTELARASLEEGKLTQAQGQLRAALDTWRGRPLMDVEAGPWLQQAIDEVERQRLDTVTTRMWAELRLGRHHELIGELSGLVCHYPDHEVLTRQLMLALYRSGRPADAIVVYTGLRHELAAEHGVTPSRRTEELYTRMLDGDPALESKKTKAPLSRDLAARVA